MWVAKAWQAALVGAAVAAATARGQELTQLDVHYVVDASSSIAAADGLCLAGRGATCWRETALFVNNITSDLLSMVGGFANVRTNTTGLAFSMASFSGKTSTGTPSTENITGGAMKFTETAWLGSMYILETIIRPGGGTCPSQALGYALSYVLAAQPARENKIVVVLTDGLVNKLDLEHTLKTAENIRQAGAKIIVVAIGGDSGWTESNVEDVFGEGTELFAAGDFVNMDASLTKLSAHVGSMFAPEAAPGASEGAGSDPSAGDDGQGDGPSDTSGAQAPGASGDDGVAASASSGLGEGAIAAIVVGGLLVVGGVGAAVAVRRQRL